jgi:hypothetical protein
MPARLKCNVQTEFEEYIDTDALQSAVLRRLHADWQSRRGARRFPARTDFDPVDLKYILGNLSLVDVRRHPLRFFFRLHATNIAARAGHDMTGKLLDQHPDPRYRSLVLDHYLRAVDERRPVAVRREGQFTDSVTLDCEVLVLPLARDGENIDMLMVGFVWD